MCVDHIGWIKASLYNCGCIGCAMPVKFKFPLLLGHCSQQSCVSALQPFVVSVRNTLLSKVVWFVRLVNMCMGMRSWHVKTCCGYGRCAEGLHGGVCRRRSYLLLCGVAGGLSAGL